VNHRHTRRSLCDRMLPKRYALRSPAPPFSLCRVNAPDDFPLPAFRRSRKLGTAFRSLITTLSRHYEVNAPALFLRFHAGTHCESVRSETVLLDIGFDTASGGFSASDPLSALRPTAIAEPPVPTPLWAFQPSGSKRSTGSSCNKPALPDARSFPAPEAVSFDPALNARKAVFAVAWLSFRKPWN
jgi:hypothetical protein